MDRMASAPCAWGEVQGIPGSPRLVKWKGTGYHQHRRAGGHRAGRTLNSPLPRVSVLRQEGKGRGHPSFWALLPLTKQNSGMGYLVSREVKRAENQRSRRGTGLREACARPDEPAQRALLAPPAPVSLAHARQADVRPGLPLPSTCLLPQSAAACPRLPVQCLFPFPPGPVLGTEL